MSNVAGAADLALRRFDRFMPGSAFTCSGGGSTDLPIGLYALGR